MSVWSWLALIAFGSLAIAAAVFAWAYRTHPVALLDWSDRALRGGDSAIRVAAMAQYGADPQQKLELIVPANGQGPWPVVLFIHGGAWDSGDPHDYRFVARALAPHGYAVVLAGYRLWPKARYPDMLVDGAAATRWVVEHGAALGADPSRIVLMGHSAGAYNAAMLLLDRQWLGREGLSADALRGFAGLAGPYDFLPLDVDSTRRSFGSAPDLPATQPVNHARGDAPPALLVTGDADTTVRPKNSLALARALTAAGMPTDVTMLPGVNHERLIMAFARPFDRDQRALDAVLPFLARVTASAPVQPANR